MSANRALITGITGQDGAYLAKFLLDKGYEVFGTYRRLSTPNFWRLHYLGVFDKVKLIPAELIDTFAWTLMLEYFLFHRCGVSRTIFLEQPIVTRRTKAETDGTIAPRWWAERANNFAFTRSDFYKTLVEQQALNIYYNIKMSELSASPPPLAQKESDIILAQDSIRRQEPPVLPLTLLKIRILRLFPSFLRPGLFKLYMILYHRLSSITFVRKIEQNLNKRLSRS